MANLFQGTMSFKIELALHQSIPPFPSSRGSQKKHKYYSVLEHGTVRRFFVLHTLAASPSSVSPLWLDIGAAQVVQILTFGTKKEIKKYKRK